MHKFTAPFEIKALTSAGEFEGYAAIFGNVDLGGDVIEPGAFREFVTNKAGAVVMLLQHDAGGLPIGTATVEQDAKGLRFKGKLLLEDPLAQRAYVHIKAESLTGMSIGYDVLPGGAEILESGIRKLTALKLWEISPVIFGMNPAAQIESVKTAPEAFETKTDLENYLRKAGGFSRTQAKALVAGGYEALKTPRKADDLADLTRLVDYFSNFKL